VHNAEQAVTPSGLMLLFYSVGKSRKYEAGYHLIMAGSRSVLTVAVLLLLSRLKNRGRDKCQLMGSTGFVAWTSPAEDR
jgi:hypothetical protein